MLVLIIAAIIAAEILLIIFLPGIGWSILAFVGILLLIILLVPLGVHAGYLKEKFFLSLKISAFEIKLLPKNKKEAPSSDREKKQNEKKQPSETKPKEKKRFPFNFEELIELTKKALQALGKFGKLTVHRFMLHYLAAGSDPYKTAITFGYVNSALSALAPICKKSFRVKDNVDVCTSVDFTEEKVRLEAELSITLRLIQLVHVALVLAFSALPVLVRNRRRLASEKCAAKDVNKNLDPTNNAEEKTK